MTVSQEQLWRILLYALVLGVILGAIYDIFRIFRLCFNFGVNYGTKNKKRELFNTLAVFFEDLLYFIICSCVACVFIFYMNSGRFRSVALLGALAGFTAYHFTLGRVVMICSDRIIRFVKKLLKFIFRYTFFPLFKFVWFIFNLTVGRLIKFILTQVRIKIYLKSAKGGFGVIKNRGKFKDEKSYKHIRKSRSGGVHSVLRGYDHQNAV